MADKKYDSKLNEEDDSGESGSQGGQIAFHEFISTSDTTREDLLPDELKRTLSHHRDGNEERVKKQKDRVEFLEAVKNNEQKKAAAKAEKMGYSNQDNVLAHPVIGPARQFSGDKQTTALPTDFNSQANEADRSEQREELRLGNLPKPGRSFNPRPTPT
jgi:hypothetical protein